MAANVVQNFHGGIWCRVDIDVAWAVGYGFQALRGSSMFPADNHGLDSTRDSIKNTQAATARSAGATGSRKQDLRETIGTRIDRQHSVPARHPREVGNDHRQVDATISGDPDA